MRTTPDPRSPRRLKSQTEAPRTEIGDYIQEGNAVLRYPFCESV